MATPEEEARELARRHYQVELGITEIFLLNNKGLNGQSHPENNGETIKLLEVNENTIASGIMPIQFAPIPAAGINYPSVIVEVTPDEFTQIQQRKLALPDGWEIGERIPKPKEDQSS